MEEDGAHRFSFSDYKVTDGPTQRLLKTVGEALAKTEATTQPFSGVGTYYLLYAY